MTKIMNKIEKISIIKSLKLSLIHDQVLKFLRNKICQKLTDSFATLQTFRTNLQMFPHNAPLKFDDDDDDFFLQKMIHCSTIFMLVMHILAIFHLIMQFSHVKIFLEKKTKTFQFSDISIQSNPNISQPRGHSPKKTNLQKSLWFSILSTCLGKIK